MVIKSRRINGRVCSTHGGDETCVKILFGQPEGKRLLGRPRLRWAGNIKMNLQERGWESVNWIDIAQDFYEYGNELAF
jgi:hypothetical protein